MLSGMKSSFRLHGLANIARSNINLPDLANILINQYNSVATKRLVAECSHWRLIRSRIQGKNRSSKKIDHSLLRKAECDCFLLWFVSDKLPWEWHWLTWHRQSTSNHVNATLVSWSDIVLFCKAPICKDLSWAYGCSFVCSCNHQEPKEKYSTHDTKGAVLDSILWASFCFVSISGLAVLQSIKQSVWHWRNEHRGFNHTRRQSPTGPKMKALRVIISWWEYLITRRTLLNFLTGM